MLQKKKKNGKWRKTTNFFPVALDLVIGGPALNRGRRVDAAVAAAAHHDSLDEGEMELLDQIFQRFVAVGEDNVFFVQNIFSSLQLSNTSNAIDDVFNQRAKWR